jgi:hypothetical protein
VSDTDSFLEEVAEEVRRDKFYAHLKKYGWIAIAIVLLVVGVTAYLEVSKSRAMAAAQARGDALTAAFNLEEDGARAAALGALAADADTGAALLQIGQASLLSDAGDVDGAIALFATVADDTANPEIYRQLATLKSIILRGNAMDIQERLLSLETLSGAGAPFRHVALEQRALALLAADDRAGAIATFTDLLQEQGVSSGLQRRASQMIVALGGELPTTPQLLSDQ